MASWGSKWFRHLLLDKIASSRHTLNAQLKLNDKADYSFAPLAVAA